MAFPGVGELISRYQTQAKESQADTLGYYVAPCAYAQLQVVEQAIRGTGGLVDADLAAYTHSEVFHTVLGITPVVKSSDRSAAVRRYRTLLGANVVDEFQIPNSELTVTVLPGLAILTGSEIALKAAESLVATLIVDSLERPRHNSSERAGRFEDPWVRQGAGSPATPTDPSSNS
jgi:hypothetical protein